MATRHLMLHLFEHFSWMDEQLQMRIRQKGWPDISRPQSMVMLNIAAGIRRPAEIARRLGVSRQAVHTTIRQLATKGIVELTADPDDQRHRQLVLTEKGQQMRRDAQAIVNFLTDAVQAQLGQPLFEQMMAGLEAGWSVS